jgi:hypothetical protein
MCILYVSFIFVPLLGLAPVVVRRVAYNSPEIALACVQRMCTGCIVHKLADRGWLYGGHNKKLSLFRNI